MVAHAQRPVADPAGDADEFHVGIRVGAIHLGLLIAAGAEETRRGGRKGLLSTGGKSGGEAYQVLLGDAHLHELVRELLCEGDQTGTAPAVAAQHEDVLVSLGMGHQGFADDLTVGDFIHARHAPFRRQSPA